MINKKYILRTSAKLLVLFLYITACGCITSQPVAPLVSLPEAMMPTPEDQEYKPWCVVISPSAGDYAGLENAFIAELKAQLAEHGIQNINSDEQSSALLQKMLEIQVRSGEEVKVSDLKYEMSHADGVVSVTITSVSAPRRNAVSSRKDKNDKTHYTYTSEVEVSGYYTLVIPETGLARTVPFKASDTESSKDNRHQFSEQHLANNATIKAGKSKKVALPLYTQFPLCGFVTGEGELSKNIQINRGSKHGVQKGRKWKLIMESRTRNNLTGEDVVFDKVIGTARTVKVYENHCVAKCSSKQTRLRAKLGMSAQTQGFAFDPLKSIKSIFGCQ